MRKFNQTFQQYNDIGPLVIRCLLGFHLIQTTLIPLSNMDGVVNYFTHHSIIMPSVVAPAVVYLKLICGILFFVGAFVRPAAVIMIITMTTAILIAHSDDIYMGTFPAYVVIAGSLSLLFTGAGKISIDHLLQKQEPVALLNDKI